MGKQSTSIRTRTTQRPESQFRLISYNIHKGIGGVDRRYSLQRIVETLAFYRPDIVLLQEVDDGVPRSRRERQVDLLAEELELSQVAFQRNVTLKEGHYGNAVLSRYPLHKVHHRELTIPFKKRRRAIATRMRIRFGRHVRKLLVVNVHLGLAGFERKLQLRRLLNWGIIKRTHRNTAMIIAGDFNDVWGNLGRQVMEPAGFASACGAVKTFPAIMPVRTLDRIFYRGGITALHAHSSRLEVARQASDHLPLVADFEFVE